MSVLNLIDVGWGVSRVYDAFRNATPGKRRFATIGAFLVAGLAAPRMFLLHNGVDRFAGPDWRAHEVAQNAWHGARAGRGVHRPTFWVLGAQVRRVWKDPGHCEGRGSDPLYEYRAEVQTYTLFALPLQQVDAVCGATRFAPSVGAKS